MEPTFFYVGLYFLVSLLHLASSKVDSYNGWKNSPNTQYHIQTDEGEERYFKYQTKSGQYRKEKRLQDGTVVGTYGWVDANGYLRLRDYIADNEGYRILKTRMVFVGDNSVDVGSAPGKFYSKPPSPPSFTFQAPYESNPQGFGGYSAPNFNANAYVPPTPNTYIAPSPNTYVPPSTNAYVPPGNSLYLPPGHKQSDYPNYSSTTPPSTIYQPSPTQATPLVSYPSYYPSSTPLVEVSPNSAPRTSTASPYSSSTASFSSSSSSSSSYPTSTSLYSTTTASPLYKSTVSSSFSPRVTVYDDPTPKPLAVYSSTSEPVAVNYVSTESTVTQRPVVYASTPTSGDHSTPQAIAAIRYTSSASLPSPPPIAGKFAYFDNNNNNFYTETEKNKLFFQNEGRGHGNFYSDKGNLEYNNEFQEYDGIATVQNGFRYFLPRHYHEEQSSVDGQNRAGSFGYIDPFGIRRVIYYNASPGKGFVHRKNNRYVGFHATPYDPRPTY